MGLRFSSFFGLAVLTLLSGFFVLSGQTARFLNPGVEQKHVLKNGLTILMRSLPAARNSALVVLYDIGSDHDPQAYCGLAHLIEHLYVTAAAGGRRSRSMEEFARQYPLGWNAQTGGRYTVFATVFPTRELENEIEEAAARMKEVSVSEADLWREKSRIAAELFNMYEGMPDLAAGNWSREQLRPLESGCRRGGWGDRLRRVGVDQIRDRLNRFYKPNHAVLVLAGDFEISRALKGVENHFNAIPAGEGSLPLVQAVGPRIAGLKVLRLRSSGPAGVSLAGLAFKAPQSSDPLFPAFLVLAAMLQESPGGMNSAGVQVRYAVLDEPDVLQVSLGLTPGESPQQAVQRLTRFLRSALERPLKTRDVPKVWNAFGFLLNLLDFPDSFLASNCYGVAFSLGRRHQLGMDPAALRGQIEQVSSTELGRAYRQFFSETNSAAVVVVVR